MKWLWFIDPVDGKVQIRITPEKAENLDWLADRISDTPHEDAIFYASEADVEQLAALDVASREKAA